MCVIIIIGIYIYIYIYMIGNRIMCIYKYKYTYVIYLQDIYRKLVSSHSAVPGLWCVCVTTTQTHGTVLYSAVP